MLNARTGCILWIFKIIKNRFQIAIYDVVEDWFPIVFREVPSSKRPAPWATCV